jgi:hypothetical protein
MKVKINIFLSVLALIFAGIVYYIMELEKQPYNDVGKKGVFNFSFLGSDIKSVGIKYKDWNVDASNIDGRWYILSPVYDLAKQGVFESIFSMVDKLKFMEVVTPEDMEKRQLSEQTFGIDKPEAIITLFFENEEIDIIFGNRTLLGDYIYVKRSNSENIYTVKSKIIDILPLTVDELRDPEMFNVDISLVDFIKMRSSRAGYVELIKNGGRWFFKQPDVGPVDEAVLKSIFEKLKGLKISGYVWQDSFKDFSSDENNILYEKYGLNDAQALFGISLEDPIIGDIYNLKISQHSPEDENLYYVVRKTLPDIFSVKIEQEDINVLNFSFDELKNKELFHVDEKLIKQIEISKRDDRFIMIKAHGIWTITEPGYAVADFKTVSSFLNYFTKQARIVEFIPPEKVESLELEPYIKLSIGMQKETLVKEELQFFISKSKPGNFYGKFIGRKDIFLLPYAAKLVFGGDVLNPFLFYNKTVLNIPSQDIDSINVKQRGKEEQSVVLNKDVQWVRDGRVDGIDMVAVNAILFSVANLRAECIVDDNTMDLEKYGLKEPVYVVKIGFSTDAGIQKSLLIGALAGDDGARYAMVKGKEFVFVLSPAELSNLTLDMYKDESSDKSND